MYIWVFMGSEREIQKLAPSEWLETYGDYLYSYALSRVSSNDQAQDLVQETLLAAFRTHENFAGKSTVKTWLTSILRSKIVDYFRSRGQRLEVSWEGLSSPFEKEGTMKGHWIDSKAPDTWNVDAIAEIESGEFMSILAMCLDLLPENWRSAVSLKLLEELNTDHICKELGISPSNLWVIIHRAKVKLRDCLGKNWFTENAINEKN